MAFQGHNPAIDSGLVLKTAGAVASTASGASLSGGVAYVDLTGAANAYARFAVVIDWTACEVDSSNEIYDVRIEGSDATGFSTTHVLCRFVFGTTGGGSVQPVNTPPNGRKMLFLDNVGFTSATDSNSITTCRYIRLNVTVSGAGVTTGMNLSARIVPMS